MDDQEAIFATLERLGLPYRLLEHAPVRGMEDCARIAEPLGAVYPKNLFLAPRSGRSQYLLLLRPFVRFDASKVSKQAGSPRLQFAGDDALFALLRAQPGAITPLGLSQPGAPPPTPKPAAAATLLRRARRHRGRPRGSGGARLAIGRQVFFREEASKPDRKPEAAPRARSPRITVRGSSLPSRAQYSPTPSAI